MSDRDQNIIAWQGWQLRVPQSWNPVKLDGDWNRGEALLVDLDRPRLGFRWQAINAKKVSLTKAMRDEVGQLAANEAKHSPMETGDWSDALLYIEPEPPGRDVWIGYSRTSGRMLQIVHHARRRERILEEFILPNVRDQEIASEQRWSVFELSCIVSAGMSLAEQKLMAGDLSLSFGAKTNRLTIRQIAVAELALKRLSLDKWLLAQQRLSQKHYKPCRESREVTIEDRVGLSDRSIRRRRFFWMRQLPREIVTYALHERPRDRLVIAQGSDESLVENLIKSVGWANAT